MSQYLIYVWGIKMKHEKLVSITKSFLRKIHENKTTFIISFDWLLFCVWVEVFFFIVSLLSMVGFYFFFSVVAWSLSLKNIKILVSGTEKKRKVYFFLLGKFCKVFINHLWFSWVKMIYFLCIFESFKLVNLCMWTLLYWFWQTGFFLRISNTHRLMKRHMKWIQEAT
jgi:hypothetical protein